MTKGEQQRLSYAGLAGVALALVLTVAASWIASGQKFSSIDKSEYDHLRSGLQSYAGEAHLLASEYRDHRASNNYVKISAVRLHEAVSGMSDQIEDQSVPSGLAGKTDELNSQASDLAESLSSLELLPNSRQAGAIDDQIKDIMSRVDNL